MKNKLVVALAGLMSIASLVVLLPRLVAQQAETAPGWSVTSGLSAIRSGYTATLLPSGKILVAGGETTPAALGGSEWVTNTAELYDPVTGVSTPTGSLLLPRVLHTATLLPNGKVLVAGGFLGSDQIASGTELYEPPTGTWRWAGSSGDFETRDWWAYPHTATLLTNGKVLLVGNVFFYPFRPPEARAVLYDAVTHTLSPTGNPQSARAGHTTTLLANGKVLIAGGARTTADFSTEYFNGTEVYDPATGT